MKCETCKNELLNYGGLWIHPDIECNESDGCSIIVSDKIVNNIFQNKYGSVDKPTHILIIDLKNKINDLNKEIKNKENKLITIKNKWWYKLFSKYF